MYPTEIEEERTNVPLKLYTRVETISNDIKTPKQINKQYVHGEKRINKLQRQQLRMEWMEKKPTEASYALCVIRNNSEAKQKQ